jgi:putative ABC transport system permease protein
MNQLPRALKDDGMFRHYLVTALRNFTRHKLYSFINVAGLSIGLACATLIALFVRDELSYDRWIPDSSNLYRVELTFHLPGRAPWRLATAPFPLLGAMQEQIPEVRAVTHLVPEAMTVAVGDRQFLETVAVVDPDFFQMLKLPWVEGDPNHAFAQPESIVLSQSIARKYFGNTDPLGKTMTVKEAGCWKDSGCVVAHPLTVTGVLKDLPHNTQLAADLVLPNTSQADELLPWWKEHNWTSTEGAYGYVALVPGADRGAILTKLKPILDRNIANSSGAFTLGSDMEEFHLIPFRSVHLTSDQYGGMRPPGSWTTVYGFSVIAILILLVACFNFTNLSTARAMLRAREISLRKTVGAKRSQLIVQTVGEAVLMALVALLVALALVEVLLPAYDRFLDRPITFHYAADWHFLLGVIAVTVVAGVVSGAYPALVLSRFRPATVLKTSAATQTGSGLTRLTLVVLQFAVSIGLGISAIVVASQIGYLRTIDPGFNRDGIVIIRGANILKPPAQESFARALSAHPGIVAVALSTAVPFDLFNLSNNTVRVPGSPQTFVAHIFNASPEFPRLYGVKLLAGRLLSHERGEDRLSAGQPNLNEGRNVLINAEAARRFGYGVEEAIGKTIVTGESRLTIAGVLGDAKIDGMKDPVQPTVYLYKPDDNIILVSVRVHRDRISDSLSYIDNTWRSFAPGSAISRYFLSDIFDSQFKPEEKQDAMFGLFVAIAIFIACLGLFGLAAFTAERRTKEIGVRKVFGARTIDIVRLLLWQFSIPVLIANAIAWPVAYYYLHHWLESYAYRISLNPLYFLTAGVVALAIAWFTVLAHAVRVARANPIHALRYE